MPPPLSSDPLVTVLRPTEQLRRVHASPTPRHGNDVEEMLHLVFDGGAATSRSLGAGYQRLWSSLTEAAEGGKRFRPALFVVGYLAWGGSDDRSAAAVGAGIELLHTAFVVHDDVIDGDRTRRGRPNVSGSSSDRAVGHGASPAQAHEYGVAAGILAGDLALVAALRTIATCPAPRPTVRRLLDLFDSVLHTTAAGELADVWASLGGDQPTVEEALLISERKTGEYSFALPLQAAAVLAGAPDRAVEKSGEVGRALGVAYQLVDDLQGAFGDPRVTGKSSLSDLRSGKQTPLVAHARTTDAWPAIAPYVGLATLTDAEADVARGLLTASGSRRAVEEMAGHHVDRALALARDARMPAALVAWITGMTTDILGRAA